MTWPPTSTRQSTGCRSVSAGCLSCASFKATAWPTRPPGSDARSGPSRRDWPCPPAAARPAVRPRAGRRLGGRARGRGVVPPPVRGASVRMACGETGVRPAVLALARRAIGSPMACRRSVWPAPSPPGWWRLRSPRDAGRADPRTRSRRPRRRHRRPRRGRTPRACRCRTGRSPASVRPGSGTAGRASARPRSPATAGTSRPGTARASTSGTWRPAAGCSTFLWASAIGHGCPLPGRWGRAGRWHDRLPAAGRASRLRPGHREGRGPHPVSGPLPDVHRGRDPGRGPRVGQRPGRQGLPVGPGGGERGLGRRHPGLDVRPAAHGRRQAGGPGSPESGRARRRGHGGGGGKIPRPGQAVLERAHRHPGPGRPAGRLLLRPDDGRRVRGRQGRPGPHAPHRAGHPDAVLLRGLAVPGRVRRRDDPRLGPQGPGRQGAGRPAAGGQRGVQPGRQDAGPQC